MPTLLEFSAALLEVFEGCRLRAYRDSGGVLTIGIGHTRDVIEGMEISYEQALVLFAQDQAPLLAMVANKPVLEAGALVSFGFNCGATALRQALAGELKMQERIYDRRQVPLRGLIARRRLEGMLIELVHREPNAKPPATLQSA